jgi:hypothetical protein
VTSGLLLVRWLPRCVHSRPLSGRRAPRAPASTVRAPRPGVERTLSLAEIVLPRCEAASPSRDRRRARVSAAASRQRTPRLAPPDAIVATSRFRPPTHAVGTALGTERVRTSRRRQPSPSPEPILTGGRSNRRAYGGGHRYDGNRRCTAYPAPGTSANLRLLTNRGVA